MATRGIERSSVALTGLEPGHARRGWRREILDRMAEDAPHVTWPVLTDDRKSLREDAKRNNALSSKVGRTGY